MKKLVKLLAIIASVCLLISFLIIYYNPNYFGNDWLKGLGLNTQSNRFINVSKEISNLSFNVINIDIISAKCEFVVEDCSSIKIDYKGYGDFSIKNAHNSLYVTEKFKLSVNNKSHAGVLTITLPKGLSKDVVFNSISGDFSIDNYSSDTIKINSISGKIEGLNNSFESLTITTTSGACSFKNILLSNAIFNSVSGKVDVTTNNIENATLELKSISGKVETNLDNIKKSDIKIKADTVSGRISILKEK